MHRDAAVQPWLAHFSDPEAVRRYADGPPRFVPGFADLHRMTRILLAEQTAQDGSVLVLGAGGGLELKALAEAEPRWNFVGVDPALAMLKLAEQTLGPFNARIELKQGYIDDAPEGPLPPRVCSRFIFSMSTNGGGRQGKSTAVSGPARPLWRPIPVFRRPAPSARDGCRAMPPMRSPPAPIRTKPTMRAPRSRHT
jgi:hypothetical protein